MPGIKLLPWQAWVQELTSKIMDLEAQAAVGQDALQTFSDAQSSSHAAKDKGPGRGGWMPKIISAMTLWYLNKTHELGALFDSWYHDNEDLAQLVDKGITDHHGGHH